MLKNYLKVALRNMKRHKSYSFINIAGLAIGMGCCVVLFLYIQNELSYDRFHEKADRIFRVFSQSEKNGQVDRFAWTPAPLAPALLNDFPEVEQAVRLGENVFEIIYQNKRFYEQVFFADPEIFEVFSFLLIKGNPETRLTKIFGYVALLSIFIACLDLFGLASFTIEHRTKEIGIRKVLGASVSNLFLVLSTEFARCVLFANIIAWPLGYYFMNRWIQNFAYRINIDLWPFVMSGFIAFSMAILTVSYQAIKAALANPVDSLRYE